jgi:DNA invertase Pin-like site-specific DNA recombinase
MPRHPKIDPRHLERRAYVYIRQSSLQQVEHNLESQDLQYQLVQRAQALGWHPDQVTVIDDDLGKSAATAANRAGLQELVSAVGLGQVGLILVIDVSRLARNCSDWYRLLDLAALCDCLIGDAGAVYDPRDHNDRLLLGIKGTLAEAQWHTMRQQLSAARLNKARRGELALRLPVGYDRTKDGQVVLTPDLEVQGAIRLVFELFERLGSARSVLLELVRQKLDLPRRLHDGPGQDEIDWVRAHYMAVYQILKHPAYAGAYTYGKHRRIRLPEGKVMVQRVPLEEWQVLIRDAFPGYISWEQYMHNQERLRENAQGANWDKGTPRQGEALLQGIVICGRCGRHMRVRTGGRRPAYACYQANRDYGAPRCQHFTARHVDKAVIDLFLEAVQPARLEVALAAVEQIETQRDMLAAQWQKRLERARYEAELARRRYEQVDPDNRLVAGELEQRWEERLRESKRLQQEWQRAQQQELAPLSEADRQLIRELADDLPALWHAETTTNAERKHLLRCLIQDVSLDRFSRPGVSIIHVRWHTGTTTTVEVERPQPGCWTPPAALQRIQELAPHHPDDQIAVILNEEDLCTGKGMRWTANRVEKVRKRRGIPTGCPCHAKEPGPRGDGLLATREAARRLGVDAATITTWFRRRILHGHQRKPNSALWVRLGEEDQRRLDGSTPPDPDLVPIRQAAQRLGITAEQVWTEISSGRLVPYRLRVKKRWVWHVQLPAEQLNATDQPCEVHCV